MFSPQPSSCGCLLTARQLAVMGKRLHGDVEGPNVGHEQSFVPTGASAIAADRLRAGRKASNHLNLQQSQTQGTPTTSLPKSKTCL